ncbi:MAG: LAGLIDADG family homing endonuclease [Bacteroidales bacterium]|nr:LAGLIDADG family homing endonuclease [Bacteroidales bacterium]
MRHFDADVKTFVNIELENLANGMNLDPKDALPKKAEHFIQKIMKDNKGEFYKNELVHNLMHRFRRNARKRGFNKIAIEGAFAHGKSEQMCIGLCLHEIAKNPEILIKIVHISDSEAVNRVRAIGQYIKDDSDFKRLCPHIQPSSIFGQEKFIVKRKTISKDPTCQAYSVLSSSLGGRANLIIYDDINDLKSAVIEPTTRENVEMMLKTTWNTRLVSDFDQSESILLGNRWHNSLLKNTEIVCIDGFKNIQDVKIGDRVLTSNHKFEKVLKTHVGPYKGFVYKIFPFYFTVFKSGGFTADHPIKTRDGYKFAKDITTDDYLIIPIPKYSGDWKKDCLKHFPKSRKHRSKRKYVGKYIPKKDLEILIKNKVSYKEISKKYRIATSTICRLAILYNIDTKRFNNIPKSIFDDLDFWRILGYWVAEGSFTEARKGEERSVIRFTFGSHEKDMIDDVVNFFKKYNIHVGKDYTIRNSCNLKISCRQLALWIKKNFDEFEHNKKLPHWFYGLPEEYFVEFVTGYFKGDGYLTNGKLGITSVSKNLLFQLQLNFLRFGIISSLNMEKYAEDNVKVNFGFGETTINIRDTFVLNILDNPYHGYIEGDNFYVKVRKIKKRKFNNFVYDITTPSHDFVSPSFVIHNSDIFNYIKNNPMWAWMSIGVMEDKNNLFYRDCFGRDLVIPLWSKFPKSELESRHIEMGDRDYNRGFRLIPYSDKDKTLPAFENCCTYGFTPERIISDIRDWIFVAGVDFSSPKREGTVMVVGAMHKHTGLKVPVELIAVLNTADLSSAIIDTWQRFGVELYLCENNAVQGAIIDLVQSQLDASRFRKYNIKIDGFNTGRNKADPNNGLPSLQKEMEKGEWGFYFERQFTNADDPVRNLWYRYFQEMKFHPFYQTSDFLMATWFMREAFKKISMSSSLQMLY